MVMDTERDIGRRIRGQILLLVFAAASLSLTAPMGWLYKGHGDGNAPPMNDCFANLVEGEPFGRCHPLFEWYIGLMMVAFMVSLLSYFTMAFEVFAKGQPAVIIGEKVIVLLCVHLLDIGLYIGSMILFGKVSYMAVPAHMVFVVFVLGLMNIC